MNMEIFVVLYLNVQIATLIFEMLFQSVRMWDIVFSCLIFLRWAVKWIWRCLFCVFQMFRLLPSFSKIILKNISCSRSHFIISIIQMWWFCSWVSRFASYNNILFDHMHPKPCFLIWSSQLHNLCLCLLWLGDARWSYFCNWWHKISFDDLMTIQSE